MSSNNPFAVLGLAPEALRGLSNTQIKKLIKNLVRGLQSVHHEDTGSRSGKMSDVNAAVDALSDPKAFSRYKKLFLRKSTQKELIANLEKQLEVSARSNLDEANQLWSYITSLCGYPEHWGPNIQSAQEVFVADRISEAKRKHFQGKNWHDMSPRIIEYSLFRLTIQKGNVTKEFLRQSNRTSPVEIFLTRSEDYSKRIMLGCLPEVEISKLGGVEAVLYLLQGARQVPQEGIIKLSGLARDRMFENQYHIDNFKVILTRLSPNISINGMIFSLSIKDGRPGHVEFDGSVITQPAAINEYGWYSS